MTGVLCVEFFLTRDGRLLVNEVAPRPHNSGHLTIDACITSQFEQQLRAVCGLPLGSTEMLRPAAMANLLGDLWAEGRTALGAAACAARSKAASLRQNRAAAGTQDGASYRHRGHRRRGRADRTGSAIASTGKLNGSGKESDLWIVLIGIFKLVKGIGLLILGVGLLRLLHRDVAAVADALDRGAAPRSGESLHPPRRIARIFRVTPKQLRELSAGTFIYAGVFLTEGTGLLTRRHWAEYMTLISTGLFMPLEVYEVYHRFTWLRLAVLILNIATVCYLGARITRRKL